MGIKDKGYTFFEEGQELVEMIVISEDVHETILGPTKSDIERVCSEYDLDFDYTWEMVCGKQRNVHTMFIDVEKYRAHLKEIGRGNP